jgi:hypothetical protein
MPVDAQSLINLANQYQTLTGALADQVIILLLGYWANGI